MTSDLYSRQTRLREVGIKGQQRIVDANIALGTDEASRIAADYLTRSGIGCVQLVDSVEPSAFIHANHFTHPISRDFAHGSWLATKALVELLGLVRNTPSKP
jgi:hypothetical protein